MRPVLFTLRGARIPSYTAMLYLGLLAGTYAAYAAGRAEGLPGDTLAPAILALLVPAVLGARVAFVIGRWPAFRHEPTRIISPREGGAVAYGALLAVPLSFPLLLGLAIPIAPFWDAGAVGFLAAVVCLRIGCLLNGCCRGRIARMPTQALEAAWAAALLVGAAFMVGRLPFAGALFLVLLGAYALGRFALDFARDQAPTLGPLSVAQAFSVSFVLFSTALLQLGTWTDW
jgi:phosphatidylglycerol---prolipoprotein diacylglyceryl transferase